MDYYLLRYLERAFESGLTTREMLRIVSRCWPGQEAAALQVWREAEAEYQAWEESQAAQDWIEYE